MDYYRKYELPETYQRYKGYTEQFSKWLWDTAEKRGLEIAQAQDETVKHKKRRVPVSQLLTMTKEIAGSGVPLDDVSGLADLNDAIRSRKEVKIWYETHARADEGHSFIIGTLIQARQILKDMFHQGVKEHDVYDEDRATTIFVGFTSNDDFAENDQDELATFSQVPTSEFEETMQCNSDQAKKKSQKGAAAKIRCKEEVELEQNLHVLCFLYDLYQHRQVIRQLWSDFVNREIDFVTAAIPTDMALATIKQNVASLIEDLEETGGRSLETIIKELQKKPASVGLRNASIAESANIDTGQAGGLENDIFCTYAIKHVEEYIRLKRSRSSTQPPQATVKHKKTDQDTIPETSQGIEGSYPHMDFLLFFDQLRIRKLRPPIIDNFTRSMIEASKRPSSWLPFGFQIILDIQGCLLSTDSEKEDFFHDINEEFFHITDMIRDHCDYEDNMWALGHKPEYMSLGDTKFSNVFLKPAQEIMDWTEQMRQSSNPEVEAKGKVLPMEFISMHPLMSSLVLYHFRRLYNSIAIGKIQWFIVALCHLYNACRQVGGLNVIWPDLEYIMDTQGAKRIFVGNRPTEPRSFYNRLCLGMASSSRSTAKDHTSRNGLWARADKETKAKRGLPPLLPLECKIRDYYYNYKIQDRWIRLHNLYAHINSDHNSVAEVTDPTELCNLHKVDPSSEFTTFAHSLQPKSARKNRRTKNKATTVPIPTFSPLSNTYASLLTSLKASLRAHELHGRFDYLSFYRRAFNFVLHIRDNVLFIDSKALTQLEFKQDDTSSYRLLSRLLESLRDIPKNKNRSKEDTERLEKEKEESMLQLHKIADLMGTMIAEEGGAELCEAEMRLRSYREPDEPPQRNRTALVTNRFTYCSTKSPKRYARVVLVGGATYLYCGTSMRKVAMSSLIRLVEKKLQPILLPCRGCCLSEKTHVRAKVEMSVDNNVLAVVGSNNKSDLKEVNDPIWEDIDSLMLKTE